MTATARKTRRNWDNETRRALVEVIKKVGAVKAAKNFGIAHHNQVYDIVEPVLTEADRAELGWSKRKKVLAADKSKKVPTPKVQPARKAKVSSSTESHLRDIIVELYLENMQLKKLRDGR